jgi:hypothetical protein
MNDKAIEIAKEIVSFLDSPEYLFTDGQLVTWIADLIRSHLAKEWTITKDAPPRETSGGAI